MLTSCTSSLLSGTLTVPDNAVAALPTAKTVLIFMLIRLKVRVNHIVAFWSQGRDIPERDGRETQEPGAGHAHPRSQPCFEVDLGSSSLHVSSVNVLDPFAVEDPVICLGKSSRMFRSALRAPPHASEERFMVGPVVECAAHPRVPYGCRYPEDFMIDSSQ